MSEIKTRKSQCSIRNYRKYKKSPPREEEIDWIVTVFKITLETPTSITIIIPNNVDKEITIVRYHA